jgi:lysophospholipase L1-like esterase
MDAMRNKFLLLALVILFTGFRQQGKTWVALGDSITYLNDHTNETGDRITKGYMTLVTEQLKDIHYVNKGFNGWTAVEIAKQIETLGLSSADIYTVFLGTNDWWAGNPIGTMADFEGNTGFGTINGAFRIILDKFKSLNPQAKVILITPMQRSDFVYINGFRNNAYGSYKEKNGQTLEQLADAIRAIGKHEKLKVIDLYHERSLALKDLVAFKHLKDPATGSYKNFPYPDYIGVPFNPDTDEYPYPSEAVRMTYDGLHPSDAGYAVITKLLVKAMKK